MNKNDGVYFYKITGADLLREFIKLKDECSSDAQAMVKIEQFIIDLVLADSDMAKTSFGKRLIDCAKERRKKTRNAGKLGGKASVKQRLTIAQPSSNSNSNSNKEKKPSPSIEKQTELSDAVIDFLNNAVGSNFSKRSKKTIGLINARASEGYTLDDFKKVITNKAHKWLKDPNQSIYLRPSTLFAVSHFDDYLNEVVVMTREEKARLEGRKVYSTGQIEGEVWYGDVAG